MSCRREEDSSREEGRPYGYSGSAPRRCTPHLYQRGNQAGAVPGGGTQGIPGDHASGHHNRYPGHSGKVQAQKEVTVNAHEIERVLMGFKGKIEQRRPAIPPFKYKGKALYKWAREGQPWMPNRGVS